MNTDRPALPALPSPATLETWGPRRAAAFWLERLQQREEDDTPFHRWLTAHDTHQQAWDDALDLWDSFDEAGGDDSLEQMRQEALTFPRRRVIAPWLGYAAAACLAAAIGAAAYLHGRHPSAPAIAKADLASFGPPDFTTRPGERRTVALSDGSRLTLDSNSAVDIAYQQDRRMVRLLRGQVFFDVAHDADRPFRLAVGERIVTVLGTRFNVETSAGVTRVLLVLGSVGLSKGSDPALPSKDYARLAPGQEMVIRPGQSEAIVTVDPTPRLAWRQGFLQFDGQTLAEAVEELNRYSAHKLVVHDPRVAALRISGAFPTDDTERFVQTLTALYPVDVATTPDGAREILPRR